MTSHTNGPAFAPLPGLTTLDATTVIVGMPETAPEAVGFGVCPGDDLPAEAGFAWDYLTAAGFTAEPGSTFLIPKADGPDVVLVGLGAEQVTVAGLRDAAAAVATATKRARIQLRIRSVEVDRPDAIAALVEGALLARYTYSVLLSHPQHTALTELSIDLGGASQVGADRHSVRTGLTSARAAVIARDLANTPPGHLTASAMADLASDLGERFGFTVTAYDKTELQELGCGGLLGVNQGSAEEPRMIVLRYTPEGEPTGKLGLIGKGIMYDSGGISLKPSDPMHLLMKMDMGGAAAVLGAFTGLRDLNGSAEVVGWLMCTDNMPSGSSYKLGDVLTARDGTTIEVKNTDAEGRLVMSDAFALANEEGVDAIVDIATLTGAALVSLGPSIAALLGNDADTISLVKGAAAAMDEPVWQLPLEQKYRRQLNSDVADIANLGGPFAGTITAALFLAHFAKDTPWAHLDIAGTMQVEAGEAWRPKGATGFGARLLLAAAAQFAPTPR